MESLDTVAADINRRNTDAVVSQVHKMPETPDPKARRARGREAKKQRDIEEGRRPAVETPKPKRKPGRPKGSKNKKNDGADGAKPQGVGKKRKPRKKAEEGTPETETQIPKRTPGRPKGSKNKKTLAREAEQAKRDRRINKDKG
ncbi:MAG: hypothetical protein IJP80_01320 [Bacteroidales bacterium]|nr:hypothetical protein [Bacteroidales bacterium]